MANLKALTNILHQGIVVKAGMIVDDVHHGLSSVAQNLIARGLAEATDHPATHTLALVNGAQEAMPLSASASEGKAPNVETDAALKAAAKERQVAADAATANQVNDTANKEAEVRTAPAAPSGVQPTAAEVAAAAAQVN